MYKSYINEVIKGWKILAEIDSLVDGDISPQIRHNNRRFVAEYLKTGEIRERTLIQMRNFVEHVPDKMAVRGIDYTGFHNDVISVIGRTIRDGEPACCNGRPLFDCKLTHIDDVVVLNRTQICAWIEGINIPRHLARSSKADYSSRSMYATWQSLKYRISNPKHPGYKTLGAKGYTISDEWAESYTAFNQDILQDIGPRETKFHCLLPVEGKHFEKGNVYWFKRSSLKQMVYK